MTEVSQDVFWDKIGIMNFYMEKQYLEEHIVAKFYRDKTDVEIGEIHYYEKICHCCHSIEEERKHYLAKEIL